MKCPNCGYFNLPNAQVCGQCRRTLSGGDNDDEVIRPPRAKNRNLRQQANANSRLVRQSENAVVNSTQYVKSEWYRTKLDAKNIWYSIKKFGSFRYWNEFWNNWGEVLCSLVPGVGHFFQQRYLRAAIFFALYLLFLFFTVMAFLTESVIIATPYWARYLHQLAITTLLFRPMILILIVWVAMFDVAQHRFRSNSIEGQQIPIIQIALWCGMVCFSVYSIIFWILGRNS